MPHELLELNQPSGQEVPVFWIGLPAGDTGDHPVLLQTLVVLAISGGLVLAAAA